MRVYKIGSKYGIVKSVVVVFILVLVLIFFFDGFVVFVCFKFICVVRCCNCLCYVGRYNSVCECCFFEICKLIEEVWDII